jgi:hypothetical protein
MSSMPAEEWKEVKNSTIATSDTMRIDRGHNSLNMIYSLSEVVNTFSIIHPLLSYSSLVFSCTKQLIDDSQSSYLHIHFFARIN